MPNEAPTSPRDANDSSWWERFPAFARITRGGGRVPYVPQMTATECGAACLAMVLAHHGKQVALDELRQATGAQRDGTTALDLLRVARKHGLDGRGVKLEVADFACLQGAGAILHWEFAHFVVLERVRKDGLELVDPACGPRFVTWDVVRRSFTGVALLLEPTVDFAKSASQASPLAAYARSVFGHTRVLPRILWMSLLLQLFGLVVPLLTGSIVDEVIPKSDPHLLHVLVGGCAGVVLFQFLAQLVRSHLMLELRTSLDARMTVGFFAHLVELPYEFFQLRSAGDLLLRLNSNTSIREMLTNGFLSAVLDGTMVFLYLVVLLVLSPQLALVALTLGVVEVALFVITRRRRRELSMRSLDVQARSRNQQIQILHGIETLKSLGGEQRAVTHWTELFVDELNASLDSGRLDASVGALFGVVKVAGPIAVLAFGATQVMAGALSLGEMLALNAVAVGFLGPLSTLISNATQLQLVESYLQRLEDVWRTPPEQSPADVRPAPRLLGAIELEDVRFAYGPNAPDVVRSVSAMIRPGQHVAIVGRSGAGKSTLASLLVGLHRPTAGRIRFDGIDLAQLELRSLREQMGVVNQQAFLFGDTVRENILLGRAGLTADDAVRAAELAGIAADIGRMPMGFDTLVADSGASLSGGQRQRLALARAVAARPAILLLDEATSALDTLTERDVQRAIAELRCTRIVIAHRLSTIVDADLILVLDGGQLVEQGTHLELIRQGGVYARMVAAQTTERG
jgi:ATP-binding cassette subfamily B protein